jgi:hypothetical protein
MFYIRGNNLLNNILKHRGIVTALSNSYFITVTEAKQIVSITSLPLQRNKKMYKLHHYLYRGIKKWQRKNSICYIVTVTEAEQKMYWSHLTVTKDAAATEAATTEAAAMRTAATGESAIAAEATGASAEAAATGVAANEATTGAAVT